MNAIIAKRYRGSIPPEVKAKFSSVTVGPCALCTDLVMFDLDQFREMLAKLGSLSVICADCGIGELTVAAQEPDAEPVTPFTAPKGPAN